MNILRQIIPTFAVPVADGSVFYFFRSTTGAGLVCTSHRLSHEAGT